MDVEPEDAPPREEVQEDWMGELHEGYFKGMNRAQQCGCNNQAALFGGRVGPRSGRVATLLKVKVGEIIGMSYCLVLRPAPRGRLGHFGSSPSL